MRRALVFAGQGSQRTGMALDLLHTRGNAAARAWDAATSVMRRNFGLCLLTAIRDNPPALSVFDATVTAPRGDRVSAQWLNVAESTPRAARLAHPRGVLALTPVTQAAVLAAEMTMLADLDEAHLPGVVASAACVAGHSLGEFAALCALGVFPVEVAVELVYRRGHLMEASLDAHHATLRRDFHLYAANPARCRLVEDFTAQPPPDGAAEQRKSSRSSRSSPEDVFAVLVELVGLALARTTSFVEIVNANAADEQYVVAGDAVALAVLGKCLDAQFRANCGGAPTLAGLVQAALAAARLDKQEGVSAGPNAPGPAPFVPGSNRLYGMHATLKRQMEGPDDGRTPSLDRLSHLTLEDDGRSGLKKKSWFVPLASVDVPFHSSVLRRAMAAFHPVVLDALPSDDRLRAALLPTAAPSRWVTNLTGTTFDPAGDAFRAACEEHLRSRNVGEQTHVGRFDDTAATDAMVAAVRDRGSPLRELVAAVLAGQLAHVVQWIGCMDEIVRVHGCREVLEVAPQRTLAELFRRSKFADPQSGAPLEVRARWMPVDLQFPG